MSTTRRFIGVIGATALATAVIGMSACDGATLGLGANANGSVAFSVDRVNSGLLGLASSPPNEMSSGGHTIVLSSATMTASELELRGLSDSSGGSATTSRFETGPVTIDVPVEGGTSRDITAKIANGTYDKFEMQIRTVHLKGTYDDAPFDITVAVNDELEMRLLPALVVAEGTSETAVKVALDLPTWFRSTAGGLIDPRKATSDTTIAAALRANIRSSFEASEDHEREGSDD